MMEMEEIKEQKELSDLEKGSSFTSSKDLEESKPQQKSLKESDGFSSDEFNDQLNKSLESENSSNTSECYSQG